MSKPVAKPSVSSGGGRNKPETPVVTVDEQQLRHSAVVASTFANLQLMTTKETLTQYSGLYQTAKEDLTRVNEEMVERDRDNMKVVDHLRSQNKDTTERMKKQRADLESKIEAQRVAFQHEKEALNGLLREKDRNIEKLNGIVDQQQADLDSLNAFKRERHEIHTEISNYKQRQAEIAIEHEQEMSKVKFAALEERVKLKAEERLMRERFEADVSDQAAAMLDAKTRAIHTENAQLQQDKILQQQVIDQLTKDNKTLKAQHDSMRREFELSQGAEGEYAQRCARQNIASKETRKQIQSLEQNLTKVIETYEGKLKTMSDVSSDTVSKLQTERDSAYRNAEGRQKELVKLRAVAKQVVSQRGELEMFFHEALTFVRKEILAERAEANKQLQIQAQTDHLLRIKGGSATTTPSKDKQSRSQLHQFLPKEKMISTTSKSATIADPSQQHHQFLFSPSTPMDSGAQSPNTARSAVFQGRALKAPIGASNNVSTIERGDTTARRGGDNQAASVLSHSGTSDHFDVIGTGRAHVAIPPPPSSAPASTDAVTPTSAIPSLPAIGRTASVASSASTLVVVKTPTQHQNQRYSVPQQAGYMGATASANAKSGAVPASPMASGQPSDSDFIDIADLSWTDKERVLRILFAKINSRDQRQPDGGESATVISLTDATQPLALTNGPHSESPAAAKGGSKRFLRDADSTTFFTQ